MNYLKTRLLLLFLMIVCLASLPAVAQQVKMPRAKTPLLLFGFEGPDGVSKWIDSGFKPEITTEHVSEGTQAMTFTVPKYENGGLEYPMTIIDWDNGKGYSTKDWSHYGKIAFDIWIDGDTPQDLSIALRNRKGDDGISERFTIQPGKKNTIELADAKRVIDSSDLEEFLFFAGLGRPNTYKVTIDNIRLIPGYKSPLADFDLIYPNYRNMIFPDVKNIKMAAAIQCDEYDLNPSDVSVNLTATCGSKTITRKLKLKDGNAFFSLPVGKLPVGSVTLVASVTENAGGKILVSQAWTLKKITRAEAALCKSYIDANNNLIVDGKPFFPIGWYTNNSDRDLDEVADSPFNCILSYYVNKKPKAEMLKYMDKAQQKGLKLIYCMNDLYPSATYIDSWEGTKGNAEIAKAVVNTYKDHPALLAWYNVDELPKKLLPELEDYYRRIANEDPNHPCYIVLYNMADIAYFTNATDVLGSDPYPMPNTPITQVSDETDITIAAGRGYRAAWQVLQAFAWYQHTSPNEDRSHIPTPEELASGRAPSYDEGRCMTYLALTHGAKGILYWCYYDLRWLPQYNEMWTWMKSIGSEVKTLSPMLLSPEDLGKVKCVQPQKGIHTKLKKYNGEYYLMAVNSEKNPCSVTLDIGKKFSKDANVMFENRALKLNGSQLTDNFKPLEVHVYNLGKTSR